MSFIDYQGMLRGWCDRIDPNLAPLLVNYAWRDIRQARVWSFLIQESAWTSADLITTGLVTVVNNSLNVTFDATAKAALNAAAANPPMTTRQFRLLNGPIYNITNYNTTTGVAILDRVYAEVGASAQGYQVYKCYYEAPSLTTGISDFVKFNSVVDPVMNRALWLNKTRAWVDWSDPIRLNQSQPFWVVEYKDRTTANAPYTPLYELWPHPTSAQSYTIEYQSRGVDFSADGDMLPPVIPDDLLNERALYYALRWQIANSAKGMTPVNALLASAAASNENYQRLLQTTKMADENLYMTNLRKRQTQTWIGAEQMQLSWPFYPNGSF